MKPLSDRAYFYLVYGTRHPKRVLEFRGVEQKCVAEQERVRLDAKQASRVTRTGQDELFVASAAPGPLSFDAERRVRLETAEVRAREILMARRSVAYADLRTALLESPYVWERDVTELVQRFRTTGKLEIAGMSARERTPKEHHELRWRATKG